MKPRKAFSLVEMLMTMTMGSSLMLLAIGLVHQSMSMSKLAKIRGEHAGSLDRLAQHFRGDVHAAAEVVSVSSDLISLKLADESTVTYKVEGSNVTREKTGPGTEVARELFRFDERCCATFASQASPQRIAVQVERRLENTEVVAPIDLSVVAVVGRWQQLEQTGGILP